jgi:hypothetical protein
VSSVLECWSGFGSKAPVFRVPHINSANARNLYKLRVLDTCSVRCRVGCIFGRVKITVRKYTERGGRGRKVYGEGPHGLP